MGQLQFIANSTQPDIAYAVNRLGAYTANPSLQYYGALKQILRYLNGTKNLEILYQRPKNFETTENLFHGCANAAFANADDLKSIIGYIYLVAERAVTWRSKKQVVIVLSSTEAEYIAMSEAAQEACWLRNLYDELGFTQLLPTILKGNNKGSITMTLNPQFHQRSKHIMIWYH